MHQKMIKEAKRHLKRMLYFIILPSIVIWIIFLLLSILQFFIV